MNDSANPDEKTPDDYLAGHVSEALATDARTHELGISVSVRGDTIYLRGEVAAAQRRQLAADVASQAAPGMQVQNDISVSELHPPGPEEVVT